MRQWFASHEKFQIDNDIIESLILSISDQIRLSRSKLGKMDHDSVIDIILSLLSRYHDEMQVKSII